MHDPTVPYLFAVQILEYIEPTEHPFLDNKSKMWCLPSNKYKVCEILKASALGHLRLDTSFLPPIGSSRFF